MNAKDAISEIVNVNKVIVDNGLNKLLPITKEMQEANNSLIKPFPNLFKDKYGVTERTFIKRILESYRKSIMRML